MLKVHGLPVKLSIDRVKGSSNAKLFEIIVEIQSKYSVDISTITYYY